MARTSAKRSSSSVIRTYAAADRASAERSFEREREQAAGRGWEPMSQRWRTEGREHVLTVVYESRDAQRVHDGQQSGDAQGPWDTQAAR